MIISAIVACSENGIIGQNNQIPWHLPADWKYFKKITTNHHILMGRKCYESIGKALPGRTNLVLTRNQDFFARDIVTIHSLKQGLKLAEKNDETELFILGGAELYKLSLDICDKIYFNTIHAHFDGDTHWPEMDWKQWKLLSTESFESDEKNIYPYSFSVFERRK